MGEVEAIRKAWRSGHSPSLKRRRRIAGLAAVGLVDSAVISLYQLGAIRRLPDLPLPGFDSNRVSGSKAAYALRMPDGPLGALFYASTLVLLAFRGDRKTGRKPWASLALGGAVLSGCVGAMGYLLDMALVERRACPYCLVAAGTTFAIARLTWPEVSDAVRGIRAHRATAAQG